MSQKREPSVEEKKVATTFIDNLTRFTESGIYADINIPDRKVGKKDHECMICLERAAIVVFLPCRHLACCGTCSGLLDECPKCRGRVGHKFSIYNDV
jgi:hypothetical protein